MKTRIFSTRFGRVAIVISTVAAFSAPQVALADVSDVASVQGGSSADPTSKPDTTTFELATGVDYSTGDYGAATNTSVVSIPVDMKAQLGRLRLQASLPYVFLKGPGQLVGGVIVSAPGGATVKRDGIGDLSLTAAYLLNSEHGALPAFEIGGAVKLPTAKTTIGTGETDFSATLSAYKSLSPQVMLFGSVGYSWLGSPSTYQLKNGITASGGLNFRPEESQNYGVSVAYREPVAAGLKGQAVVSPYMTYKVTRTWGFTLYGIAGLNNASPNWGAGLRLSLFQ